MLSPIVDLIDSQFALESILEPLRGVNALALDIETINWWDPANERVALVQLAFREATGTRVVIIDALAGLDLEPMRGILESGSIPKVIHNASFDAVRLARHYNIHTTPIFDTMLAARRSGERRWSLKAQVEAHLGFTLDKQEQRGDWSRRPLLAEQLRYAALDASSTLVLYELQLTKGLRGDYALKTAPAPEPAQTSLPLRSLEIDLLAHSTAILGIVVELSGRYSPEQLAASVGSDRVGLAGWIVDRMIGREADIDEGIARNEIARLREEGLIKLNDTRRLEPTASGTAAWKKQ